MERCRGRYATTPHLSIAGPGRTPAAPHARRPVRGHGPHAGLAPRGADAILDPARVDKPRGGRHTRLMDDRLAARRTARHAPYEIEETPGFFAWCSRGRSKYQPYSDGSHAGTGFAPVIVEVPGPGRVRWCGCKLTATPPFGDDSGCAEPEGA